VHLFSAFRQIYPYPVHGEVGLKNLTDVYPVYEQKKRNKQASRRKNTENNGWNIIKGEQEERSKQIKNRG
jgi:hypothetical protein